MKYTVSRDNGVKEIVWEIGESSPIRYPTPSEISEAASKEFPGINVSELAVIPEGGGDAIILTLARYAQNR